MFLAWLASYYVEPARVTHAYRKLTLLYLALRNIAKKWNLAIPGWRDALNRFAIIYENRLPLNSVP